MTTRDKMKTFLPCVFYTGKLKHLRFVHSCVLLYNNDENQCSSFYSIVPVGLIF